MIKKILLFSFIMLLFVIPSAYALQVELNLFNDYLEPANPTLKEKYEKINKIDDRLESVINELRIVTQSPNATQDEKTDLASLLLRKALLSINLPHD
ncbi:MAG: hypothetical protein IKP71_04590, partial [Candidatus Riflebacteria bacterium]|nr:hypothetical protein [Candidatus Riflebacteria bacterium]